MNKQRFTETIILAGLLLALCACSSGGGQSGTASTTSDSQVRTEAPTTSTTTATTTTPSISSASPDISLSPPQEESDTANAVATADLTGQIVISFNYVNQSGSASNQFAVWVEDMDGNCLQTVFATRWTANGGFETRPDSIALWVEKSGITSMPSYYVDAVSGATPQTGEFNCVWDLTDVDGNTVTPGEYRFFVEGTLRWKNYVLYSGIIEIGDAPATVQADAEFIYEGSGNQSALTSDSPENAMIGAVSATFIPGTDG